MGWFDEMTFLTIRHGLSDGQMRPQTYRDLGDSGVPLYYPTGFGQAKLLGQFLNRYLQDSFSTATAAVLSSRHTRAYETLAAYSFYITAIPLEEPRFVAYLGEQRFGDMNGMVPEKAAVVHSGFLRAQQEAQAAGTRHLLRTPGFDADNIAGECQHDVWQRAKQVLSDARELYDVGIRLVIINTHGSAGRAAQMNILGIESSDKAWQEWKKPNNCQVDQIQNGKRTIIFEGFPEPKSQRPALRLINTTQPSGTEP